MTRFIIPENQHVSNSPAKKDVRGRIVQWGCIRLRDEREKKREYPTRESKFEHASPRLYQIDLHTSMPVSNIHHKQHVSNSAMSISNTSPTLEVAVRGSIVQRGFQKNHLPLTTLQHYAAREMRLEVPSSNRRLRTALDYPRRYTSMPLEVSVITTTSSNHLGKNDYNGDVSESRERENLTRELARVRGRSRLRKNQRVFTSSIPERFTHVNATLNYPSKPTRLRPGRYGQCVREKRMLRYEEASYNEEATRTIYLSRFNFPVYERYKFRVGTSALVLQNDRYTSMPLEVFVTNNASSRQHAELCMRKKSTIWMHPSRERERTRERESTEHPYERVKLGAFDAAAALHGYTCGH
ncbi:hypothetical protein BJ508DRAFT_380714 [Ascobolus immersus RN42]|uniref:Uncharacterized protein n=1 Tax=Ascobolus immersus RN42 TaxID=1160509 RepID=A0A3N4HWV9_ASCIM|nr:hypothetical protein BJ508DRAFT_380714 [Ascobolus immersus RN42]